MTPDTTDRPPVVPPEATVQYVAHREETGVSSTPGRPEVLRLARRSGGDQGDLRTLLRQRLRLIATLLAIAYGLSLVQKLLSMTQVGYPSTRDLVRAAAHWPDLWMSLVNVIGYGIVACLLWRRALPSLRRLRGFELLIFGQGLLSICINNWYVLNTGGWLAELLRLHHLNILATWQAHSWFVIIAGYGTLIPNTGRRCALVVGSFAIVGLAIAAGSLAANSVSRAETALYLLHLGVSMMLAVGLAVVGSHRLEVLRREASEARRLGQYRLKRLLGAGGMGEVYLAEHVLLRRPCAVKLIRPERAGDPGQLGRFEREVQATARLTHPNTVQVFDYGHADDGTFYYAMEYLPGLTLEQLVEEHGPLPPARTVHFLRQLCGSLSEAHAAGLIHRDIKPGNVVICQRGGVHDVAKLLDFGLVHPIGSGSGHDGERLTADGTIQGTPAYMSPEQAGGQADVDARNDLYSLGALAYYLLTGRSPFAGRPPLKMLAAHVYEPPIPPTHLRPDVPQDLEAVVLRCLAKAPAERYADAIDLDAALAACQAAGTWTAKDAADWWRCRVVTSDESSQGGVAAP